MQGICTECNNTNIALHHYLSHLCYNCYEKLFEPMPNPFDEEPDFELENEVATIKPSGTVLKAGNSAMYISNTDLAFAKLIIPKEYKLDPDCRYGLDLQKLIKFILDNSLVTDKSVGFDKVSYMFKEVK